MFTSQYILPAYLGQLWSSMIISGSLLNVEILQVISALVLKFQNPFCFWFAMRAGKVEYGRAVSNIVHKNTFLMAKSSPKYLW